MNAISQIDHESELAVAFAAINWPEEARIHLPTLTATHFADPHAKNIVTAFEDLDAAGKTISTTTVCTWLRDANLIDAPGPFFADASEHRDRNMPHSVVEVYRRVEDHAHTRRVGALLKHADAELNAGRPCNEVLAALTSGIEATATKRHDAPAAIEFLRPSELRDFEPPSGWNLVGDFHLQRESVTVIGGAPGIGKSRALLSLAVAGANGPGAQWFGLGVHRRFRTMILQTENGRVRLQRDFAEQPVERLDEYLRVCPPPPFGIRFDRADFCAQLRASIREFRPDVIGIDPWNAVAAEDKQRDYLAAFEAIRSALPPGVERPAFVIVAHTRKPSANERHSGAGLLATLAGSYVLGSVPRAAFVVQRATNDTTDDRIVWTCCKNNDGEMGQRSAWVRSNGSFDRVDDFDWQAFDNPDAKAKREIDEDVMAEVFADGARTKAEAVRSLIEDHGFQKSAAYAALDESKGRFAGRISNVGGLISWT